MGPPQTSPEAQAVAGVLLAGRSSSFRRVPASAGAFFVYNRSMATPDTDRHWSRMDITDLRRQVRFGDSIAEIANFLRRTEAGVEPPLTPHEAKRIAELLTEAAAAHLSVARTIGRVLVEMPHIRASEIVRMSAAFTDKARLDTPCDLALQVEVEGDDIVIRLAGTHFMVTYRRPKETSRLTAKSDWTDDPDASVTFGEFRARAWIAAAAKARELGWIV